MMWRRLSSLRVGRLSSRQFPRWKTRDWKVREPADKNVGVTSIMETLQGKNGSIKAVLVGLYT
jgi:hypothetical protein